MLTYFKFASPGTNSVKHVHSTPTATGLRSQVLLGCIDKERTPVLPSLPNASARIFFPPLVRYSTSRAPLKCCQARSDVIRGTFTGIVDAASEYTTARTRLGKQKELQPVWRYSGSLVKDIRLTGSVRQNSKVNSKDSWSSIVPC